MKVELRAASSHEIPDLMPLLRDLYREDIGPYFTDVLGEYIDSANHIVTVAASNVGIVGVLVGSYRLDIDHECRAGFVDAIVVAEEFRGRGIGKRMLRYFAQWAQSRQCTVLQVLGARREFFEPRGFRERPAALHQVPIEELAT